MPNRQGLVDDLKLLGFTVEEKEENNENIIASRKNYSICGEELWTDNHEVIIRPKKYDFRMIGRRHDIIFIPIL